MLRVSIGGSSGSNGVKTRRGSVAPSAAAGTSSTPNGVAPSGAEGGVDAPAPRLGGGGGGKSHGSPRGPLHTFAPPPYWPPSRSPMYPSPKQPPIGSGSLSSEAGSRGDSRAKYAGGVPLGVREPRPLGVREPRLEVLPLGAEAEPVPVPAAVVPAAVVPAAVSRGEKGASSQCPPRGVIGKERGRVGAFRGVPCADALADAFADARVDALADERGERRFAGARLPPPPGQQLRVSHFSQRHQRMSTRARRSDAKITFIASEMRTHAVT